MKHCADILPEGLAHAANMQDRERGMDGTDFAVLGPLSSASTTPAQLGCEIVDHLPRSDRPVVLRWLPDGISQDKRLLARLRLETAVASRLEHASILRVRGLWNFQKGWARITDYVDGEPIAALLEKEPTISPAIAATIVLRTAEAIHYAHETGEESIAGAPILHGGIRPDTVFITFDGRVILTGFGASVFAPDRPSSFLAPEQMIGGRGAMSVSTDVYALGALLYTLVTGKPPFHNAEDLERAILTAPPPVGVGAGLINALVQLAGFAMAKRGSDRPSTAADFAVVVRAVLDAQATSLSTEKDIANWCKEILPSASEIRQERLKILETANDPEVIQPLQTVESTDVSTQWSTAAEHSSSIPSRRRQQNADEAPYFQPDNFRPDNLQGNEPLLEDLEGPTSPGINEPDGDTVPGIPPLIGFQEPSIGNLSSAGPELNNRLSESIESSARLFANPPVHGLPPYRERSTNEVSSSITQFNRRAGDGSRSALFLAIAAAMGLLSFVLLAPGLEPQTLPTTPQSSQKLPLDEVTKIGQQPTKEASLGISESILTGLLSVNSDPPVDVFIDGKRIGRTPLQQPVEVGAHRVRLTDRSTRINTYRKVQIQANTTATINEVFETSMLEIVAPKGANILLNGHNLAKAPMKEPAKVYEGEYLLKVSFRGMKWSKRIEVPPGRSIRFSIGVEKN